MIGIDLSTHVCVVSGAGGSIGRAICHLLSEAGAAIVAADINSDLAGEVAMKIVEAGGRAIGLPMDVTDPASVRTAFAGAAGHFGGVTGLVNAAGLLRAGAVDELSDDDWAASQAVNVTGTFNTVREAVPYLRQSGSGVIVNLASVSAYSGSDVGAAYHATKGAVISFTYATAGELAKDAIRVNAVCPGWVDGGFTHHALATASDPEGLIELGKSKHYLGRMATPEDVAGAVLWLASPFASFVTGTAVFVDGGYMIKH